MGQSRSSEIFEVFFPDAGGVSIFKGKKDLRLDLGSKCSGTCLPCIAVGNYEDSASRLSSTCLAFPPGNSCKMAVTCTHVDKSSCR